MNKQNVCFCFTLSRLFQRNKQAWKKISYPFWKIDAPIRWIAVILRCGSSPHTLPFVSPSVPCRIAALWLPYRADCFLLDGEWKMGDIIRNSFNESPKIQIQYPPWGRVAQKSLSSSSPLDFLVVMPSAIRDEKSDRRIIQINQLNITDLERNFKDHRHGCFNSTKNRKVQNRGWSGNTSTS